MTIPTDRALFLTYRAIVQSPQPTAAEKLAERAFISVRTFWRALHVLEEREVISKHGERGKAYSYSVNREAAIDWGFPCPDFPDTQNI